MTLLKDSGFYWPWPILEGVPLNEQWYRIRNDTELLNPIAQSTYYENTDDIRGHAALAGYEFGSQDFSNQYRMVYIDSGNEFHFQCNEGTYLTPIWVTLFHFDCGGPNPIIFDENVLFQSDSFYVRLTAKDGIHTIQGPRNTISFSNLSFYLTKDSEGNPLVNLKDEVDDVGVSSITFKDGTHIFTDDTLNFNGSQFYLTTDSAGNPSVNVIIPSSQTPYHILGGESFTVEDKKQVLIHRSIITDGALIVDGDLIEV